MLQAEWQSTPKCTVGSPPSIESLKISYDTAPGVTTNLPFAATIDGVKIKHGPSLGADMTIQELRYESDNVIHACATASFPLPKDHWIYDKPAEPPIRKGELTRDILQEAMRYAIQVCTKNGTEDFDPDALCMTVEHMLVNRVRDWKPRTNSILR